MANIQITKEPALEMSNMDNLSLVMTDHKDSTKWHLRYGHLNIKGLKLLSQKKMVQGLPEITKMEFCESCLYGKQV